MKNLYERVAGELEQGRPAVVATIARRLGSAPRGQGTRCAVLRDGALAGTIGGGLLEARVRERASAVLRTGRAEVLGLRLNAKELADDGMICGGSVDVVLARWEPAHADLARVAADALAGRSPAVLVTRWGPGGEPVRLGLWTGSAWVGREPDDPAVREAAAQVLAGGDPRFRHGDGGGLLAELLDRELAPLVVLGAGHVGRALARVAATADFEVTVVDDRPEFADPKALPWASRVLCRPLAGAIEAVSPGPDAFVVVCTRGHLGDAVCAEEALRSPVRYVGVIGSRRKRAATLKRLREAGVPEERLAALRLPVGLDLGAETPGEIAVAVVAEMIRLRRSPAEVSSGSSGALQRGT